MRTILNHHVSSTLFTYNVNFTANMEGLLDMIAEGKVEWKSVISNFYPDLDEAVVIAEKELEKVRIADEETDIVKPAAERHFQNRQLLFPQQDFCVADAQRR